MRTKTLLATAALTAAGIASSMAQVFSVNAVGYINIDVAPGFSIIANQLNNNGKNTLADLLPAPPGGTTIYKFAGGSYDVSTYDDLFASWDKPEFTLTPGEAAFIRNTTAAAFKITFVGEVPTGNLANPLPAGFSLRSSQVPQAGKLSTDLKFPTDSDTAVYQLVNGAYTLNSYDSLFASWDPAEPTVKVGEGFFVRRATAGSWTRTFNVNG